MHHEKQRRLEDQHDPLADTAHAEHGLAGKGVDRALAVCDLSAKLETMGRSGNLTGAAVVGLDVKQIYAVTFGLGLACVGAAGTLMATIADASPGLAQAYTLLAFTIVIIGGLGSMVGALIGGVLIGVSEALAGFYIQPSMKSMFSFALLIIVLVLRPQGLMGRRL